MKKAFNSPVRGLKEVKLQIGSVKIQKQKKIVQIKKSYFRTAAKEDSKTPFPFCIVTNFLIATELSEFDSLSMG